MDYFMGYISEYKKYIYLLWFYYCYILLRATFVQSHHATFLELLNYPLLALCQKNPTPMLISWHTAKSPSSGPVLIYIIPTKYIQFKHAWSTKVCRILLNDSFTFFLQYMGLWKIQEQQKQPFKSWISNVSWGKCSKIRKRFQFRQSLKAKPQCFSEKF